MFSSDQDRACFFIEIEITHLFCVDFKKLIFAHNLRITKLENEFTTKNSLSPSKRVFPSFRSSSTIFDNDNFHS